MVDYLELPGMEVECRHCSAILFRGEPEGICCLKGTIVLPHIVDAPEPLTQAFHLETYYMHSERKGETFCHILA